MRRFLTYLGALTLALILLAAGAIGVSIYNASVTDKEALAYLDTAIPAIVKNWSKEELVSRASPELLNVVRPDELNALFISLSKLGPLKKYEGSGRAGYGTFVSTSGTSIVTNYLASAEFAYGSADFQLLLVKRDGHWMISGFHVNPKLDADAPRQA